MITIPCVNGSQQRQLTAAEKSTVTSILCDGVNYCFYQGDEPANNDPPHPPLPNWNGLTQSLWSTPQLMGKAMTSASPNVYSTLLKVLTDGEIGSASEQAFLQMFNMLGITWTQAEKDLINEHLTNNNFSIRIQ